MSLLLDALKKAARDKEEARSTSDDHHEDELELDELEQEQEAETSQEEAVTEDRAAEPASTYGRFSGGSQPDSNSVSNEALLTLIHKANTRHKRAQRRLGLAVFSGAILVVLSGAGLYYMELLDDISMIESRHRVVMRSVDEAQLSKRVTSKIKEPIAPVATRPAKTEDSRVATDQVATTTKTDVKRSTSAVAIDISRSEKVDPVGTMLDEAYDAYMDKRYPEALGLYGRVVARESENRDALLGLGAVHTKLADFEAARDAYRRILRLDPRDPIAVASLSNLESRIVDTMSETHLKELLRRVPDAPHVHFALGNLYSEDQRWAEAQSAYFEAWRQDGANADYAFNLAVSLDHMGKQDEALVFYEKSIAMADDTNEHFMIVAAQQRIAELSEGAEP